MSENSTFGRMDSKGVPLDQGFSLSNTFRKWANFINQMTDSVYSHLDESTVSGAKFAEKGRKQANLMVNETLDIVNDISRLAAIPASFGHEGSQSFLDKTTEINKRGESYAARSAEIGRRLRNVQSVTDRSTVAEADAIDRSGNKSSTSNKKKKKKVKKRTRPVRRSAGYSSGRRRR